MKAVLVSLPENYRHDIQHKNQQLGYKPRSDSSVDQDVGPDGNCEESVMPNAQLTPSFPCNMFGSRSLRYRQYGHRLHALDSACCFAPINAKALSADIIPKIISNG